MLIRLDPKENNHPQKGELFISMECPNEQNRLFVVKGRGEEDLKPVAMAEFSEIVGNLLHADVFIGATFILFEYVDPLRKKVLREVKITA